MYYITRYQWGRLTIKGLVKADNEEEAKEMFHKALYQRGYRPDHIEAKELILEREVTFLDGLSSNI